METTGQQLTAIDESSNELIIKELIEKYKDMIFNMLCRMTCNYDDAMELAQETFLKAMIALPMFRYESSMKTWLYKIAVNLAINHKRKWSLFKKKEEPLETYLRDKRSSPEEQTCCKQLSHHVQQAINRLPKDQKAMIILRDIEELSYLEISHVLGLPIGTVKSRLARARCFLKKALAAYY